MDPLDLKVNQVQMVCLEVKVEEENLVWRDPKEYEEW